MGRSGTSKSGRPPPLWVLLLLISQTIFFNPNVNNYNYNYIIAKGMIKLSVIYIQGSIGYKGCISQN